MRERERDRERASSTTARSRPGRVEVTVPSKPIGSRPSSAQRPHDAGDEATPRGFDRARVVAPVGGDVDRAGELARSGS